MIEQFGKVSSVYLDTHANATMTISSLTALFTGKHLLHQGRLSRDLPAHPSDQNILQILRGHGYTTVAVTSSLEATLTLWVYTQGSVNRKGSRLDFSRWAGFAIWASTQHVLVAGCIRICVCCSHGSVFPKQRLPMDILSDTLGQTTGIIAGARRPFFLFIHIHEPHESKVMPSLSMLVRRLVSQFVDKRSTEPEIYKHYDSALQPEVDSYKAEYEASVRTVDAALGGFFEFSSPPTLVRRGADNYHSGSRRFL